MRKHRFFTTEHLVVNHSINLDTDTSHYIGRVLRLTAGDEIYLFNNSGNEYQATLISVDKNSVAAKIIDSSSDKYESPLCINLAQVIGKGEKMDLVIQKATELGVNSITPLYSERTVVKKVPDRVEHKREHWQKIAVAASAQCWRNFVPIIHEAQSLSTWITKQDSGCKLILSTSGETKRLKDIALSTDITILIGPEGGFSAAELELALQYKFIPISLGPRILRTETTALATIACLQSMYGDI